MKPYHGYWSTDTNDNLIVHPMIKALKHHGTFDSLKIVSMFEDDHLPCVNVRVKIKSKTFTFSDWCLNTDGLMQYGRAEVSAKHRKILAKGLVKYVDKLFKDFLKQYGEVSVKKARKVLG